MSARRGQTRFYVDPARLIRRFRLRVTVLRPLSTSELLNSTLEAGSETAVASIA